MVQNEGKQSRRDFLKGFGIFGVFAIAMGTMIYNSLIYLLPKRKEKTYHKYLVTKMSDLPLGKAKEINLGNRPVFVVHLKDGFKVFSGVCTHLGCIVRWEENKDRFYCPCHQGVFSKEGKVASGPPPRALDEFPVKVEDNLVFIKVEDKLEGPWI